MSNNNDQQTKGYKKLAKLSDETWRDEGTSIETELGHAPVATTTLLTSSMLSQMDSNGNHERLRERHPDAAGDSRGRACVPQSVTYSIVQSQQPSVTKVVKDSLGFTATNIKTITSAATKVTKVAKIGAAVNAIADFIPVVGNSGAGVHYSRLRRTGRAIDVVDVDELDAHPLHRCCALSATDALGGSAKKSGDEDLAYIKKLVENDPSLLQEQLPTSGDTPLHIAIRFGSMQWHQSMDYPGGMASNLEVIEYLIQQEIDLLRKKTLSERKIQGNKNPINLESLIRDSSLYTQDVNHDLPIHIAATEGFHGAVRTLLKYDKDAGFGTVAVSGNGGNLPLHLAVLKDDMELVKLFLAADRKRQEERNATTCTDFRRSVMVRGKLGAIFKPNDRGDLPLHLALPSHLKFELWDVLLEPDHDKETLHVKNLEEIDAFHFFASQPDLCKDQKEFVDTHLAQALLERLVSGRRLEPWDDHLKRSVARSRTMQQMINNAAADRLPVMIFIADFYAHLLSIFSLYFGTEYYLNSSTKPEATWLTEVIVAMIIYFFGREFVQLLLSKSLYWTDVWNYMDLARIGMLIVLAVILRSDEKTPELANPVDEEYTAYIRRFLLALAVFMYLGFISFLRITYLQFALFVGGTAQILVTLIPFMVTFILLLCLFAYGYWVGGYLTDATIEHQTYSKWLLSLFMTSMSGPEDLAAMDQEYINNDAWTLFFMMLVQILLLNVLIAVITSAWDEITDNQNEVFWKYRLEYTAGVLPMEYFLEKHFGNTCLYRCMISICNFIDSLEDKPMYDNVDWNVYPHSRIIQDKLLYWDKARFQLLMLEELKERNDTQRTWRNLSQSKEEVSLSEVEAAWRKMRSFEADSRFATSGFQRACIQMKRIAYYILWTICFIAGFVTLGTCWPRKLRRFFCAPSTTSKKDEPRDDANLATAMPEISFEDHAKPVVRSAVLANDGFHEALETKIDDMQRTIETLQKTVEALVEMQSASKSAND